MPIISPVSSSSTVHYYESVTLESLCGSQSTSSTRLDSTLAHATRQFESAHSSGPAAPSATPADEPAPDGRSPTPLKGRDPLYRYQWHLKNKGQYAGSRERPTPGVDLNIGNLHRTGITGRGVVVGVREPRGAVIDAGHEDLAANMVLPAPAYGDSYWGMSDHATGVAGIIGAVGGNGKGGRGVAPEVRILDLGRDEARKQPLPPVINESFGNTWNTFAPYRKRTVFRDARPDAPLIVGAAGNEFMGNGPGPYIGTGADDPRAQVGRISANMQARAARWNVITVGSVNAEGRKSSYSRTGSSLWVSGLGGEIGLEKGGFTFRTDKGLPDKVLYGPAIVAPDITDCSPSRDCRRHPGPNIFINALSPGGPSELNPDCRYTGSFQGTSAAAPMVTGVAALMLQVNPALTWRDIKYLLAITARKVDAERPPTRWEGMTLEDGWVVNAAKRPFSNWYGFGLVDAKRAVDAARDFRGLPPAIDSGWQVSTGEPVAIPYRDESAGYSPIRFDRAMRVEAVQIRLRTTHQEPRNLRIALISPSGTRSIIQPPLTDIGLYLQSVKSTAVKERKHFSINRVATNAFLDENAKGEWKLQIIDVQNPASDASKLVSWELRVLGH